MLKDLDQRQVEQQGSSHFVAPVSSSSNKKFIFISLLIIVVLNAAGIFVWQMYTENQTLKMSNTSENNPIEKHAVKQNSGLDETSEQVSQASHLVAVSNTVNHTSINDDLNGNNKNTINRELNENKLSPKVLDEIVPQTNDPKEASNENSSRKIGALIKPPNFTTENSNIRQEPSLPKAQKSTLTISRKQLTPHELTKQKLKQAEQALGVNDISKAESLFEEVLLVMPEHKSARKQLAALWFGRQSYEDALNLLSQGINLSPNDSELRVMKARIYLQQNRVQPAFVTLNNMLTANDVVDVEYQSLRATTAQQLNEFSFAADAYQVLVEIEPSAGRWWLGLAVALDSNGEFKQASIAYQTALNRTGLSGSAETFARQRIIELGE